jgi:uncharacterized protein YcbX
MATVAAVTALYIHPVKSARAIARERARIVASGFEWDRQWMLINDRGTFLSQRTHPQLTQIVPRIADDALVLESPGLPPLSVPFTTPGECVAVRVHEDRCVGIEQGTAAHEWVSAALGEPARLVRVPANPERVANPRFAGEPPAPMGFADGYPLLVCNQASLDDLNARLPQPIPMERFRPNIVIEGLPAWAEDRVDILIIGSLTLRLVKPCTRCSIPSIDQRTGLRSTDPLPVLRPFRFNRQLRGITFGENAVIVAGLGCEIRRGAPCQVSFEPASAAS